MDEKVKRRSGHGRERYVEHKMMNTMLMKCRNILGDHDYDEL